MVRAVGLEPTWTSPVDFESTASTISPRPQRGLKYFSDLSFVLLQIYRLAKLLLWQSLPFSNALALLSAHRNCDLLVRQTDGVFPATIAFATARFLPAPMWLLAQNRTIFMPVK